MTTNRKKLEVQAPQPESGISVDLIKDVVRRLRAAVGDHPELQFLLDDVPPEYDPDEAPRLVVLPAVVKLAPRVSREDKKKAFRTIQALYNQAAGDLNAQLKSKSISVDDWLARMEREVSTGHVSTYSAGRSGAWASITFQEWGRLGSVIKGQFQYLRGFANEIREKGIDAFSLPQLNLRTSLYADRMNATLEAGIVQDRGLDPSILPAMPGDGTTRCLVRCKCRWAIRPNGRDKWLVSWRLGKAEHCKTCLDRSDDWVDLQVEKGRIVSEIIPHYHNHR